MGPCLIVILPADSSTLVTWPATISDWPIAPCGMPVSKVNNNIAASRVWFVILASIGSLYDDRAEHSGFAMTRDQASVLERARLGETPHDFARSIWLEALPIGLVVLHIRELLHE